MGGKLSEQSHTVKEVIGAKYIGVTRQNSVLVWSYQQYDKESQQNQGLPTAQHQQMPRVYQHVMLPNICQANHGVSALTAAPIRTRDNTHRYLQPFTRIEAYKHSFFPSTIKTWNKYMIQQLKQSLNSFLEGICTQRLHKYIFMFYYLPPSAQHHPLLATDQAGQYSSHIHVWLLQSAE